MHLLPASLAILPGGGVPARYACNGAAFFQSPIMSGPPNAARRRILVPDGAWRGRGEDGATLPFQARVGQSRLPLTDPR